MLVAGAPTHEVDLAAAEGRRWSGVVSAEKEVAARLFREAEAGFAGVPELLRWVFARLYERTGGLYLPEIECWAQATGVSSGTAVMLNCAYELSHAGMLPAAFSVTINWAPPAAFPSFDWGPSFLLRHALETCDSYESVVRLLEETPLSTSVFFTVCGVENGQACVVERTPRKAAIRRMTTVAVVQANHHVAERVAGNNEQLRVAEPGEEEFSLRGSCERADRLSSALTRLPSACSIEDAAGTIDAAPVLNRFTCQQVAFLPARGDVRIWRDGA